MKAAFGPLVSFCLLSFLASPIAAQSNAVLAVDVSYWSGNLTSGEVACWRGGGIEHVIAGTQVRDTTRQQLQTAVDGGLTVDAYVVLYWDVNIRTQVETALATISGYPVGRLWLDVEVYPGGRSPAQLETLIQQALDACGSMECGIYTGKWWWDAYMWGSTRFSHVPVWYAYYDEVASLDTWSYQSFGGWPFATGKQYTYGYSCGVNVDYNVMLVEGPVTGEPPPTPTGLSPPSGSVITTSSVTMSVDPSPTATRYEFRIEYWDGAAWQSYYTYQPTGNSQTFWPAFVDTRYRFQVRAGNTYGFSSWSEWSIFDFGNVGIVAEAPEPLSPDDGAVITSSSVTLDVSSVASAERYEFEIWYWDGGSWQYYYTYVSPESQQRFWPAYPNTAYRWHARVQNAFGTSDWSEWRGFDFGLVPRLPAVPNLVAPAEGAAFASGSVTLQVDAVATAKAYELQIEYWYGGAWQTYYTYRTSTTAQTFWPYYADTSYRWRARAQNDFGYSGWSSWWHFDFGNVSGAPVAPTPISPADGASITTSSVTLTVDPVEGASRYEFEIWYAVSGEWRYYYTYRPSTSFQTFWPVYGGTFYLWRVRAETASGWSDWSVDSTFDFGM